MLSTSAVKFFVAGTFIKVKSQEVDAVKPAPVQPLFHLCLAPVCTYDLMEDPGWISSQVTSTSTGRLGQLLVISEGQGELQLGISERIARGMLFLQQEAWKITA